MCQISQLHLSLTTKMKNVILCGRTAYTIMTKSTHLRPGLMIITLLLQVRFLLLYQNHFPKILHVHICNLRMLKDQFIVFNDWLEFCLPVHNN